MKALGIIAEFNPFHEGHKYLIDTASALSGADVCVSVMSGDFVQRGGYAYFDKWKRAEHAVKQGVDLIVELPQIYASASAKHFAGAGVKILSELSCDYMAFGSESGNLDELIQLAEILSKVDNPNSGLFYESFRNGIKDKNKEGITYPAAREQVLKEMFPDADFSILRNSNDILGIEYLRALLENDSKAEKHLTPIAIKRIGDDYSKSASSIRAALKLDDVEGPRLAKMQKKYFELIRYGIISKSEDELEGFDSANEGLGNKLKKAIRHARTVDDLIERVKSKRYTYTRISRLLTHILLVNNMLEARSPNYDNIYIRPLAMNKKGAEYIRKIKNESNAIFIDDVAKVIRYEKDSSIIETLMTDIRAADIYAMLQDRDMYSESDYVRKTILL